MNARRGSAAEEAYAIGLLQQLTALCEETRLAASSDPARISVMLAAFEDTLATLAPVLERLGSSPGGSLDAVLAAARFAVDSHQAVLDAMSLELDRIGRAIAANDQGASATIAYATAHPAGARKAFEATG